MSNSEKVAKAEKEIYQILEKLQTDIGLKVSGIGTETVGLAGGRETLKGVIIILEKC